MTDQPNTSATTIVSSDRLTFASAVFVMVIGLFLLWGAAYANPETLHNAAHDSRHALGFPCH